MEAIRASISIPVASVLTGTKGQTLDPLPPAVPDGTDVTPADDSTVPNGTRLPLPTTR